MNHTHTFCYYLSFKLLVSNFIILIFQNILKIVCDAFEFGIYTKYTHARVCMYMNGILHNISEYQLKAELYGELVSIGRHWLPVDEYE